MLEDHSQAKGKATKPKPFFRTFILTLSASKAASTRQQRPFTSKLIP
jgi:hypothetical protein